MSFESTIIALVKAADAVTAIAPDSSIWMGDAPQGIDAPFLVLSRISTVPQNTMDEGAAGTRSQLDNIEFQAACYGTTMEQSLALAAAVRRAITNEASLRALCTGQEPTGEDEVKLRGQRVTFSAWHAETISAP